MAIIYGSCTFNCFATIVKIFRRNVARFQQFSNELCSCAKHKNRNNQPQIIGGNHLENREFIDNFTLFLHSLMARTQIVKLAARMTAIEWGKTSRTNGKNKLSHIKLLLFCSVTALMYACVCICCWPFHSKYPWCIHSYKTSKCARTEHHNIEYPPSYVTIFG